MWISRINARSEAYARSEDRSSSNACTRFDTVELEGVVGGMSEAKSLCSSSSCSCSSATSSSASASGSGTGEGGGRGSGFSGVFGRNLGLGAVG